MHRLHHCASGAETGAVVGVDSDPGAAVDPGSGVGTGTVGAVTGAVEGAGAVTGAVIGAIKF